jgi:hypothetical protein
MKTDATSLLSYFLWAIAAFHVVVGVGVNVAPGFAPMMAGFYGANVEWTAQFSYIVKPLGAFMLALGIMAGIAARDPLANRPIVYGFAVLFALRAVQRIVFSGEIESAFGVAFGRGLAMAAAFTVMAVLLVWLARKPAAGAASPA